MKRIALAIAAVLLASTVVAADGVIVVPDQEYTIRWPLGENATATELQKRLDPEGEWADYVTVQVPENSAKDTLPEDGHAQYRARSVREVPAVGPLYSEYSDPSDWAVAVHGPGCPGRVTIQP